MAENQLSEEEQLKALRSGPVIEVTDKKEEVTNNTTQTTTSTENTEATQTTNTEAATTNTETTTTQTAEKPYWEQRGFSSQADLDAFIESNKVGKTATFTSKFAEEMENFVKATGKDDVASFNFYKSTELKENMEPKELIKLLVDREILDNPNLAKFSKMRQEELEKDYLIDLNENEEGITEKDLYNKEMKKIQLQKDSEKVINEIKEAKEKMANSGLTAAEIEANKATFEANKTKAATFAAETSDKFEMHIPDFKKNDKGEVEFLQDADGKPIFQKSFTFDKEEKEFYKLSLESAMADLGYPSPDSDNAKKAIMFAEMNTFYNYAPRLFKEAIAQTEAAMIKKYNIDVDNPSIKKPATAENGEAVLSEEEAIKAARGWTKGK